MSRDCLHCKIGAVEIMFQGYPVIPTPQSRHLIDLWLQTRPDTIRKNPNLHGQLSQGFCYGAQLCTEKSISLTKNGCLYLAYDLMREHETRLQWSNNLNVALRLSMQRVITAEEENPLLLCFPSQTTKRCKSKMATAAPTVVFSVSSAAVTVSGRSRAQKTANKVVYLGGINSYGGLKAHNSVVGLGVPVATERRFADVLTALKAPSYRGGGGGSLSSTCNAAAEIFKIAAIMNGLVLVGVAVGFVLLRIEASLEEAE
ncbi:hypothetical protein Nepgr_015697 [Nepenthes gracilis]|uniref:Cytochrome b6-f complex subunit 7 n=1 Tax=Nepenthes gracilis TaxID=150966 RepID=A0AAD3SP27_NEPGR|nr:hypothetical protein Nepgr_015697 [Nepenthes gracilis]